VSIQSYFDLTGDGTMNVSILNKQQQKAKTHTNKPLLIIAGPGSGKTFTLIERISYLVLEKKVKPENILISTFTEKAAKEIITRISNKLLEIDQVVNLDEMYIGTIHSICLRFIDENIEYTQLKKNYRIFDQFEQQYFVYRKLKEFEKLEDYTELIDGEKMGRWRQSSTLVKYINKISEELVDPDKLIASDVLAISALGRVYKKYLELMADENALDFSSIQTQAFYLLEKNPCILEKIREAISYIMIDEYQDTNTVQEKILLKIAGDNPNVCVVGDDDQGLYRFRGATIRNILEFPNNFEEYECEVVKLETNYRSHPGIVDFYNSWMEELPWSENGKKFRYSKNIKPQEKDFPDYTSVIKVIGEDTIEDWQENVFKFIKSLEESGKLEDYNQIAFLFRSVKNPDVKRLAEYLESKSIPVYSPRSCLFFDRPEIKYLIGAFLFLFPQVVEEVFNKRYAGNEVLDYYKECMRSLNQETQKNDPELLHWISTYAKNHFSVAENLDYAFSGLLYRLFQFKTFSNYLDGPVGGVVDSRESRNISIFTKIITRYEYLHNLTVITPKNIEYNVSRLFNIYLKFLYEGGIEEYEDMSEYAPSGCVSFLTIHQSKGMEFPVVFVGSLNLSPRKQYSEIDVILQENYYAKDSFEPLEKTKYYDFWRLFYTAFSRAQNLLVLTCKETTHRKKRQRKIPTKYFDKLYDIVPKWSTNYDLCKLKISKIKNSNIKNAYSFTSHILLYENCPLQYKFFKELGFIPIRVSSTVFGTLVHQTIEDIHKAVLRGEPHSRIEEKAEDWFSKNYKSLVKKEKVYLQQRTQEAAVKQIKRYVEKHKTKWHLIKDTEVDVSLVKPEYILNGTIDLIKGENDTVELVDFKSEKKPDLQANKDKIDRYRQQLEVYAHLVEERTGRKVSKLHLYYTGAGESENPYVTFQKKDSSITKTVEVFDEIVDKIEKKDYVVKKRDPKICKECDMRFFCDKKGGKNG